MIEGNTNVTVKQAKVIVITVDHYRPPWIPDGTARRQQASASQKAADALVNRLSSPWTLTQSYQHLKLIKGLQHLLRVSALFHGMAVSAIAIDDLLFPLCPGGIAVTHIRQPVNVFVL